jgi:hypothetical protein
MVPSIDPWQTALGLLSARPPRLAVLPSSAGGRWLPEIRRNPRHSRAPYFTPREAVDFVRTCLRDLVSQRSTGRLGLPPGIIAREESDQRDPTRRAFVLVGSGRGFAPPVYVKWLLGPDPAAPTTVEFVSFHESSPSRRHR